MQRSIENMTPEQKLGMVFCARRFQEEDVEFILELIRKRALGCVQYYTRRPDLMERILSAADYPILVFTDAEDGFPITKLPKIPLMSLAACGDPACYRAFAKGVVRDAKAVGCNGNWGPVIDILRCDGPCKVGRHFSDDPDRVTEIAREIAGIYKQNHHLSTGKHYPGGEDIGFDTHMTEGVSRVTREELLRFDLQPYLRLQKEGLLPCIMTRHTVFVNIDPEYPATLSKKVVDILREQGYDGLIFTDSFAMMGILQKYGEENIYGRAIYAGIDLVLPNFRTPVKTAFEMLKKNYADGMFSEQRLNEAAAHVLAAQHFVGQAPEAPTEFTEADRQLLDRVARDCITAVTDEGVTAALEGEEKDRLFVILEDTQEIGGNRSEVYTAKWYDPRRIAEKIRQVFPGSGVVFLPEFSASKDNERVLLAATGYREVVFVTFCVTEPYLGTDGLTRRTEAVINSLILSGKLSTVVHFGNPYALQTLGHVPRKIFGYTIPDSQLHAIDVLAGTVEAKGSLPFRITFA